MEPAEIETLIARASVPADPFDLAGCLELWLAALYATRDGLPRSSGRAPSPPDRSR